MLGSPKPRRLDQPIAVSLEGLVPTSNFYRHLEAKLDLSFVRTWTREQAALREKFAAAIGGRGRLVLVGGEAGIGKTTLARDLIRAADAEGPQKRCPAATRQ